MNRTLSKYGLYAVLLLLLLSGGLILRYVNASLSEKEEDKRQIQLEAAHTDAIKLMQGRINNLTTITAGLGAFLKYNQDLPSATELQKYLAHLVDQIQYEDSIVVSLVDTNFNIVYTFSKNAMDPAKLEGTSVKQFRNEAELALLNYAIERETMVMFEPFNLKEGWPGLAMHFGVHRDSVPIGFVATIVELQYVLEGIYGSANTRDYVYRFQTSKGHFFDRYAVHDGTAISSNRTDPEYFGKLNIPEESYLKSEIELFGYTFLVSTAHKNPPSTFPIIKYLLYFWLAFMAAFIVFTIWQINKSRRTNKQLLEAKEELEELSVVASKTNNGIVILSADNRTLWLNESYTAITGYTLEDLKDISPGDVLVGEGSSQEVLERIREKHSDSLPWNEEILVYHKDGHQIWIEISSTPVFDDQKRLIKSIEIINDVTDKVEYERELQRLSLVASETENVILILDAEGNLEWINRSFEKLNNLTLDQLIAERGRNIRTISNNEDMGQILDDCAATRKPRKYDSLNITNDGKRVWESSTLTPIFNDAGTLTNFIIIDTDITLLKDAEDEIKKKNEELKRLSMVAERMNEAVMICDAKGSVEYYNHGLVRNSGYPAEEFESVFGSNLSIQQLSSRPDINDVIKAFHNNAEPFIYESAHQRKDGTFMWTTASLSPVYDEEKKLQHIIVVYTDINERKLFADQLSEKNREIVDSINYAKRLQEAILPNTETFKNLFSESFVLYRPKDIVAGDFYWLQENGSDIMFAAADCTGHGVPGAMVSVVCSNALNASNNEVSNGNPAALLDSTRDRVVERFGSSTEDVKDGMDISLCKYQPKTKLLMYAGANNPLWIVSKDKKEGANNYAELETDSAELYLSEFKADKQPIGKFAYNKPFNSKQIQLTDGDTVYLFTDGFPDQFGGENGKKFKYKPFKKLLLSINKLSMNDQHEELSRIFDEWKGGYDQIDDVCILGIRV